MYVSCEILYAGYWLIACSQVIGRKFLVLNSDLLKLMNITNHCLR